MAFPAAKPVRWRSWRNSIASRLSPARPSGEPLFPHHRERVVESPREALEHRVDLGCGDDERRAERDDVAWHAAQDHAVVLRPAYEVRRDPGLRVEALLRRLVPDDLGSADQAEPA